MVVLIKSYQDRFPFFNSLFSQKNMAEKTTKGERYLPMEQKRFIIKFKEDNPKASMSKIAENRQNQTSKLLNQLGFSLIREIIFMKPGF